MYRYKVAFRIHGFKTEPCGILTCISTRNNPRKLCYTVLACKVAASGDIGFPCHKNNLVGFFAFLKRHKASYEHRYSVKENKLLRRVVAESFPASGS